MRNYFVGLTLALLAVVGCDDKNANTVPDTSNSKFTLLSASLLEYGAEGGHARIEFEVENPVEGAMAHAKADVDWLTDFYVTDSDIQFYVEANPDEEPRETVVLVTYGKHQSFTVGIRQEAFVPTEVTIDDCVLNGSFEGCDTGSRTLFNYVVSFTDNGISSADDSTSSSYIYRFNIYSERLHGFIHDFLPNGEYPFDVRSRGTKNSFSNEGSYYQKFGEDGYTCKFTDGTLTVSDEGVYAIVATDDGRTHELKYSGSLDIGYVGATEGRYSMLTENLNFNLDNGYIRCYYYGDFFGLGYDEWTISVVEDVSSFSGSYITFNILVDKAKGYTEGAYFGTYDAYTLDRGVNYADTFIPGTRRGYSSYSWYMQVNQGFVDNSLPSGPLAKGTITFSESDGGVVIDYDCEDDNGHLIKGRVTSPSIGEIYDVRDPAHPKMGF